MRIIEDLWLGEVVPIEWINHNNQKYKKVLRQLIQDQNALKAALPPEAQKIFSSYNDAQIELQAMAEQEAFAQGFRLGARIMLEALGE